MRRGAPPDGLVCGGRGEAGGRANRRLFESDDMPQGLEVCENILKYGGSVLVRCRWCCGEPFCCGRLNETERTEERKKGFSLFWDSVDVGLNSTGERVTVFVECRL